MARNQNRNIMNNSKETMSPRKPSYACIAGPEKLKHARDMMQKMLYEGRDRSENLRMG